MHFFVDILDVTSCPFMVPSGHSLSDYMPVTVIQTIAVHTPVCQAAAFFAVAHLKCLGLVLLNALTLDEQVVELVVQHWSQLCLLGKGNRCWFIIHAGTWGSSGRIVVVNSTLWL